MTNRSVRILGTRGVPAAHGGFETFAEHLALFLVAKGWRVTVYCQETGSGPVVEDVWRGIHRVRIPVRSDGSLGTIIFDWKATVHAAGHRDACLTLGYNTALFTFLLKLKRIPNIINMDGLEWKRAKWSLPAKLWFYLNERIGCLLGDHLVADHPEIAEHLKTRVSGDKITMIPYGAHPVEQPNEELLGPLGLKPDNFLTVIARPEPENSLLEIVTGFSRAKRGVHLAVLGHYDRGNAYCRAVQAAASDEVKFLGPIYDKTTVQALRHFSLAYVHGHQVGGTNPSLVEALAAGNVVLAHDNKFNRWVADASARFFSDENQCAEQFNWLLENTAEHASFKNMSKAKHEAMFTWPAVLAQYEQLLLAVSARFAGTSTSQERPEVSHGSLRPAHSGTDRKLYEIHQDTKANAGDREWMVDSVDPQAIPVSAKQA